MQLPTPPTSLQSAEDIDAKTALLHNDICLTSNRTFEKRKPFSPRSFFCGIMNTAFSSQPPLCGRRVDDNHRAARSALKRPQSKSNGNRPKEDLWRVAKWHHGRRVSLIPAILTNHDLSSADSSKAQAFQARSPKIPEVFPDDAPALEARDLPPIAR